MVALRCERLQRVLDDGQHRSNIRRQVPWTIEGHFDAERATQVASDAESVERIRRSIAPDAADASRASSSRVRPASWRSFFPGRPWIRLALGSGRARAMSYGWAVLYGAGFPQRTHGPHLRSEKRPDAGRQDGRHTDVQMISGVVFLDDFEARSCEGMTLPWLRSANRGGRPWLQPPRSPLAGTPRGSPPGSRIGLRPQRGAFGHAQARR